MEYDSALLIHILIYLQKSAYEKIKKLIKIKKQKNPDF
jgi:hypothetical protein